MLEPVFGNKTMEKILLFLARYGNGYPRDISVTFEIPLNGVQQQLKRLEDGGILVSRLYGRVRIYEFNPRYPFLKELRALLDKAMEYISDEDMKKYYMKRTRPRKQGKPV
jgi:DNA-binding transcriptional ArsR family regulator